jgi:uncharacterized protein YfaS (alpha-2-macroglobulin family)
MDQRPVQQVPVVFTFRDPRRNILHQETRSLSRYGVASTELPLADEVSLGTYSVEANLAEDPTNKAVREVVIDQYRVPKLEVRARPDRPFYGPGDAVEGTVSARYFFGKPVTGATVTFAALSRSVGCGSTQAVARATGT